MVKTSIILAYFLAGVISTQGQTKSDKTVHVKEIKAKRIKRAKVEKINAVLIADETKIKK